MGGPEPDVEPVAGTVTEASAFCLMFGGKFWPYSPE